MTQNVFVIYLHLIKTNISLTIQNLSENKKYSDLIQVYAFTVHTLGTHVQ
jgi:hypothetical protein